MVMVLGVSPPTVKSARPFISISVAGAIASVIAFIVCLAILLAIFGIVVKIIRAVISHIPIVGTLDRVLGFIIGAADAVITLQIVSIVITLGIGVCTEKLGITGAEPYLGSRIAEFFYNHNFIKGTLGLVIF